MNSSHEQGVTTIATGGAVNNGLSAAVDLSSISTKKVTLPGGERSLGFTCPFRLLVTGSTSCGKSRLIAQLLQHRARLFDRDFVSISYYYPTNSRTPSRSIYIEGLVESCPDLRVREGFPNIDELAQEEVEAGGHRLIVVDDLYSVAVNHEGFEHLLQIHSHHSRISLICTSQNTFQQGRSSVSILRNYSDFIVFDSLQQRQALALLGRQLFPGHGWLLTQAMAWLRNHLAAGRPDQRYLWVDCHPSSTLPDFLRVRSRLIPYSDSGSGDNCNKNDAEDWFQLVFAPAAAE